MVLQDADDAAGKKRPIGGRRVRCVESSMLGDNMNERDDGMRRSFVDCCMTGLGWTWSGWR